MDRLGKTLMHLMHGSPADVQATVAAPVGSADAGDNEVDSTAVFVADANEDAVELTPWSKRVRQRLSERSPKSWARNDAGYPLLGIDPGVRRHPHDPPPMLYARAAGQWMWDIDGNRYVDYNNAFGPHLLGYNHPEVLAAVQAELENGMHYNFPYTRDRQSELAELLVSASPAIEQVVFFNSGSDATAMALRAARAHTGKSKLGIFDGAYHGTHDWAQVAAAAGSDRERPSPIFTSDGVPELVLQGVCLLPYNNRAAFDIIREQREELAVVMIQAVQASNPRLGMGPWLQELEQVSILRLLKVWHVFAEGQLTLHAYVDFDQCANHYD
jgi:glutamate-1-semialdehyde aminotransferase